MRDVRRVPPSGVALALVLVALSSAWAAAAAAQEDQTPAEVTEESIEAGRTLFAEAGCQNCHGADATGVAGMTSDLTDGEWRVVEDGAFGGLVTAITNGLGADRTGGVPMPAMGGADLSEDQINALAAYVWSMNREHD